LVMKSSPQRDSRALGFAFRVSTAIAWLPSSNPRCRRSLSCSRTSLEVCVPYDDIRCGKRPALGFPHPAVLRLQAFSTS
jgi:hypothetical protein